jgi:cellulose synthase/poly-beta-1,6-N-acetylglucosamine synthase-like glycosyltransferase
MLLAWLCVIALATLAYIYVGYPLLVGLLARAFGREPRKAPMTPAVTLLIPAYNEEAHLEERLQNSLQLDYPKERLDIVVASDGSTDRTHAIAAAYAARGVRLIMMPRNIGKSAMLSLVVPTLSSDIVVLSDASTALEPGALRALIANFADPRVGGVCGLYRLQGSGDVRGAGEGLYWRYETWIKQQESRLHSILGAHGACYAIRKALFVPLEQGAINDDYLIAMRIVAQGYRMVYEPLAVGWERHLASFEGEFARRRRIAAGNCQQIVALRHMLHPGYGWPAFCFFSHKVLRTLAPVLMLLVLFTSPWLPSPWGLLLLIAQGLFYGSALAGFACQQYGHAIQCLSAPLYFCVGNLAMLLGLLNYCFRRRSVAWERAR